MTYVFTTKFEVPCTAWTFQKSCGEKKEGKKDNRKV